MPMDHFFLTLLRICKWHAMGCLALFYVGSALAQNATAPTPLGRGAVEAIHFDAGQRKLTISGWVAPQNPNVFVTNLLLDMGASEIYRGRFERSERADIVQATGRKDWLWSGFRVVVEIPHGIPNGSVPIRAFARLGDGALFEIAVSKALKYVSIASPEEPARWRILALVLAVLLPAWVLAYSFVPKAVAGPWIAWFSGALLLSFLLLVGAGWTGSSLGLAFKTSPLTEHNARPWRGQDRPIRSDEWEVLTPLAISQAAHVPAFPVVNKLLGQEGQNMMVIGMTGVPVAHPSSLAKPATWGFFLFDLGAALAWHWWFPFFACFAAFWLVLIRLFGLDWRVAGALSLIATASPYCVVYSGWPAYAVFFPMAALLALERILQQKKIGLAAFFGVLLGWSLAGFALVLYPSWQISIAYLMVPVALAWVWREHKRLNWGVAQAVALCLALVVAMALLSSWWQDAHEAITAIKSTVYPGGRNIEAGGDIDPWFLIKGWLSPVTVYSSSELMVPSDAGSFVFLLWAVLPAVLIRCLWLRRLDLVGCTLAAGTLLFLAFAFIGFDTRLTRITLLGFTTAYRMDLVLGVAQILMLGWLMSPALQPPEPTGHRGRAAAIGLAMLTVACAWWLFGKLPVAVSQMVPPGFMVLSYLAIGVTSYGLLIQRYQWVLFVSLAWTLSTSIPFNPLGQATSRLSLSPLLAKEIAAVGTKNGAPAIAVVGVAAERVWAMTLPAAGQRVVNSVFYYPQQILWSVLDPDKHYVTVHNRYQRLLLVLKKLPENASYQLDSPRLDEVRISLDPERFDFRLLQAALVIATPADGMKLRGNPSLTLTRSTDQWELFRVPD